MRISTGRFEIALPNDDNESLQERSKKKGRVAKNDENDGGQAKLDWQKRKHEGSKCFLQLLQDAFVFCKKKL